MTVEPPKINLPKPTPKRSGTHRQLLSKFNLEAIITLPTFHNAFLDDAAAATTTEVRTHGEDANIEPFTGGEPETYKEAISSVDSNSVSKQWTVSMRP